MATISPTSSDARDQGIASGSALALNDYLNTHKVRGVPLLGRLELQDCTRLVIYNIQGFTTKQIWTELRAGLGDLARAIVKIKRVSSPNRNPHADLWVRRDLGAALVSVIRQQTKTRLWRFVQVITEAQRKAGATFSTALWQGDEEHYAAVTHWRIALWQPWRERRLMPANTTPFSQLRPNLTATATWNINGFWGKAGEVLDFVRQEKVAVLALQETLVKANHYTLSLNGYKTYTSAAEKDFRGIAMLVDNSLASFEVPHGLNWLIHVKVFGYAGYSGPTHFINVYLKSGGNHRRDRGKALALVKKIVSKVLKRNHDARIAVLGDFNEEGNKVVKHLAATKGDNILELAQTVGSPWTRFPTQGGVRRALDHILLAGAGKSLFKNARVHREFNISDHRPVVIRPRRKLPSAKLGPTRTSFDNKMIRLKSDLIVNDNAWTRLMTTAYGEDYLSTDYAEGEVKNLVSEQEQNFATTFDAVCRKHSAKKDHRPRNKPVFPRKLKSMLQTVRRYSTRCNKARDAGKAPEASDITRLARAQNRFKKAKRDWSVKMKQRFYANVANDFIAHDHKEVWHRLNSQVRPSTTSNVIHPVKDKDGNLHYRAEEIMAVMRDHYKELLTYDPKGWSQDATHWEQKELGDPSPPLVGLNDRLYWPEVLVAIRESNRNTAPGKDGIHVNILKAMVLEECMEWVKRQNPEFMRPDNVRIDLPEKDLPHTPITCMGKAFFALLERTWQTGCIPDSWNQVHIVNLFKGGDPESTDNYRGISLISCAFKVLISIMTARLSKAAEEAGLISKEQGGFRKREEAVAQAIALAEIVRRRWIKGKPTFGLFIDFKKAYDRVYHEYLFRILEHKGVRGRFLDLVKNMYCETRYSVRVGEHISEPFTPTRGAKQGDPLSPILFIIFIDSCLKNSSVSGGVQIGPSLHRCPGLMYADDVIALEHSLEDTQATLDGIREWGQEVGMDIGREKCGVMMWPSQAPRKLRRTNALDLDSDTSSVEGGDDWGENTMEDFEFQHDHFNYSTVEGPIPTVKQYKYLGITMDTRLGDPRKVTTGAKSMELEFAQLQAKKGMRALHEIRPFLTDRHCPIVLKVAMVRNLVYGKMLYGAELIGFQLRHAEPMQRVINTAAKWIMGLQKHTSLTDAFTLCYELGLPPIHQELSAMRARLAFKLMAHNEGGLKTWLQTLWDNPASGRGTRHTWVSLTKKWLNEIERDKNKFARLSLEEDGVARVVYMEDETAPLRPWAQLGKAFEMQVRSNSYRSNMQDGIQAAFLGVRDIGLPPAEVQETPLAHPEYGLLDASWSYIDERQSMDIGRNVPRGRSRWEVTRTNLVRDVILERMMSSNRAKGFSFYNKFNLGVTRGYLREAANRPDLAEGVRWLSLTRTRAFPTVEGAWQRIRRSGQAPSFRRGVCPLCEAPITQGWEWAHLLTSCQHETVMAARQTHLDQCIHYIKNNYEGRRNEIQAFMGEMGREREIALSEVLSICLIGGMYRPEGWIPADEGWFDIYFIGFGGVKLITPGLESYGFTYVASFFQRIAPLYMTHLCGSLYGDWSETGSDSGSSIGEEVDTSHLWWTEGDSASLDEMRNAQRDAGELEDTDRE